MYIFIVIAPILSELTSLSLGVDEISHAFEHKALFSRSRVAHTQSTGVTCHCTVPTATMLCTNICGRVVVVDFVL